MKRFISLLLCVATAVQVSAVCVFAGDVKAKAYTNYDIIVEMAKAYDRQGEQIPYDQKNARRSIYASPEDATAQRTIFLDCSSFVNACYREAFGVNVLPYEIGADGTSPTTANYDKYAKENPDAPDVLGYWEPINYTDAEKQAVADFMYENLQIGDIVTYRCGKESGTAGHVYMYIGDNTFMHCAGAGSYVVNSSNPALSYDSGADEIESRGTIGTIDVAAVFGQPESSRYIFKKTEAESIWSFSLIRPMVRGLTPTEETVNRMKIAGLSMEKTASVCENASVDTGDILTYTVTLENTNAYSLSGVTITDTLPAGTEFVTGESGVKADGRSVSWKGAVPANTTLNVRYSVKITSDKPGALITSDATYVSGVKLGTITHSVSGYSKAQRLLIGNAALELARDSRKFTDGLQMVKSLYKSTLNVNLTDYTTCEAVLDQLIDTENNTRHTSTALSKMIAPNLYGGLDIRYGWLYHKSENDKTRLPKEEQLSVGDIILADWEGGNNVYVYAGDKTLVTVEDGVCKALTIGDNIYKAGENILISLLGYNRYAVLRPSMKSVVPSVKVSSIEVAALPDTRYYYSGGRFDTEGMAVNAILNNGKSVNVTNYTVSPEVLHYPTNSVNIEYGKLNAPVDITVDREEKITIVDNGTAIKTGINPQLVNGRTLVPMNELCESLRLNAEWNAKTNTATIKNEFRTVSVTRDSKIARVDGKEVMLDVAPIMYKGSFLVPVRFIAESFSADIDWIGEEKTVVITGGKVIYPIRYDGEIGIYNAVQMGNDTTFALDGDISTYWGVSLDDPNGAYGIFDLGFSRNIRTVAMAFFKGTQR
ncbi:MAG: DUF11 domain-containing protein, partial [Oscillospiraceae bacterium]|nr:DUF11 domain-containing protein [Oscillospiraceae bacterium]